MEMNELQAIIFLQNIQFETFNYSVLVKNPY